MARNTKSSDTTEVCFDDCNDADHIAQSLGKTPKVCEPGGVFYKAYRACVVCIAENRDLFDSSPDYPIFSDFIDYCKESATQASEKAGFSSAADALSHAAQCDSCVFSTAVFTDQSAMVHTITVQINPNNTASGFLGGHRSHTTSRGSSQSISLPVETSKITTTDEAMHRDHSRAPKWIAGPVVAAVIVVFIIFGAGIFVYRRRRLRLLGERHASDDYGKAQLHSDCLPRPELEEQLRYELDGQTAKPGCVGMTANEAKEGVPQEMPVE